jgi:hypothetical protein
VIPRKYLFPGLLATGVSSSGVNFTRRRVPLKRVFTLRADARYCEGHQHAQRNQSVHVISRGVQTKRAYACIQEGQVRAALRRELRARCVTRCTIFTPEQHQRAIITCRGSAAQVWKGCQVYRRAIALSQSLIPSCGQRGRQLLGSAGSMASTSEPRHQRPRGSPASFCTRMVISSLRIARLTEFKSRISVRWRCRRQTAEPHASTLRVSCEHDLRVPDAGSEGALECHCEDGCHAGCVFKNLHSDTGAAAKLEPGAVAAFHATKLANNAILPRSMSGVEPFGTAVVVLQGAELLLSQCTIQNNVIYTNDGTSDAFPGHWGLPEAVTADVAAISAAGTPNNGLVYSNPQRHILDFTLRAPRLALPRQPSTPFAINGQGLQPLKKVHPALCIRVTRSVSLARMQATTHDRPNLLTCGISVLVLACADLAAPAGGARAGPGGCEGASAGAGGRPSPPHQRRFSSRPQQVCLPRPSGCSGSSAGHVYVLGSRHLRLRAALVAQAQKFRAGAPPCIRSVHRESAVYMHDLHA